MLVYVSLATFGFLFLLTQHLTKISSPVIRYRSAQGERTPHTQVHQHHVLAQVKPKEEGGKRENKADKKHARDNAPGIGKWGIMEGNRVHRDLRA